MCFRTVTTLLFAVLTCAWPDASRADWNGDLWVYAPVNFQVDRDADRLIALLTRAKSAGYSGAVITDYKFGKLDERPRNYYHNLQRTRAAAEKLNLELIPLVMQIGYSNSILQNNPNLAAGLPVNDCVFVARDGNLTIAGQGNLLGGGGFETASRNAPSGWDWIDGFGTSTELDEQVKHSGSSALLMHNFAASKDTGGNCRVVRRVSLKPFHQYRITMWVKSDELRASEVKFMPLTNGDKRIPLNYAHLGVKPTQDWTRHRIVFNSLQHRDVSIYIGLWNAQSGRMWIDDVVLEEVGGVNLLRREGCPIRVRSDDGSVDYEEGRDFQRWEDPHLGRIPYLGEFDDDHDAPPIQLTRASRISAGDRIRVSFYHTVIIHDGQVCASLLADEVFALLRGEIQRLDEYLKPRRFFMSHDEIRVAGWDELAGQRPAGQLLAENVRRCERLIRDIRPDAEILVWSDMFDPHHNARDEYYLVRGSLADSWTGLDSSTRIVNWNSGKAQPSLTFFASRGHRQVVAGYYDGDVARNVESWKTAARGVSGVDGFLYTTWRRDYKDLEEFARRVRGNSQ
jgi:hypothetical protein